MIDNNLNNLNYLFQRKIKWLLAYAKQVWLDVYVFEGKRTVERQQELFWYGRTKTQLLLYKVNVKYAKPNEKKRTRTMKSKHIEGKAVDIVFDLNKDPKIYVPTWNGNYQKMIWVCLNFWLKNLYPRETCHFEDDWRSLDNILKENSRLFDATKSKEIQDICHFANNFFRNW
jgi:hypothetical protein